MTLKSGQGNQTWYELLEPKNSYVTIMQSLKDPVMTVSNAWFSLEKTNKNKSNARGSRGKAPCGGQTAKPSEAVVFLQFKSTHVI